MKVTGYLLREAIRKWELRRDSAANMFNESLHKFDGEDKLSPDEVSARFTNAEESVSKLQEAQARYNLLVKVSVQNRNITLLEAVKRIGGAGRSEKMWRTATSPKKDPYSYRDNTERDNSKERAKSVLSTEEREDRAHKAAAFAGIVRAAIATGNGTEVDSEVIGLSPDLLT